MSDGLLKTALNGRQISCEACGTEFQCGPFYKCWCSDFKISTQARAELKDKYKDCLCPSCLGEAADRSAHSHDK